MYWHKAGGYDVPLFVPAMPGSQLVKQLKEVEERSCTERKIKFRFEERAGTSMKSIRACCCACCRGEKGGDCRRNNVTYQIVCEEFEKVNVLAHFKGETSKNTYTRGLKHLEQLKTNANESVL